MGSATRKAGWAIAIAIIAVIVIISGILLFQYTQPSPRAPTTSPSTSPGTGAGQKITLTIYGGEIGLSQYGFGNSSGTISSPGPSFTVKSGTTVTVNFYNAGSQGHNWALVLQKADANEQLAFPDSVVQSNINPVAPSEHASCTFTADKTGTYYYICQVDSHVSLGMWGFFTVVP